MSFGNGNDSNRGGGRPSDPFAANDLSRPVAKKSNAIWWILGILGVLTAGGALLCCGGAYFMYSFTTEVVAEMVKATVENDPAVQEHVGTIEKIEINLTDTGNAGGGSKLVFDVTGDKGAGKLEVVLDNSPQGQSLESCVLVLPNGDRHNVTLQPVGGEPSDGAPEVLGAPEATAPVGEEPVSDVVGELESVGN